MANPIKKWMFTSIFISTFSFAQTSDTLSVQMIDLGGYELRVATAGLHHIGNGAPCVLLEAGAFQGLNSWRKVMGEIAQFAAVMAYDRAGIGGSDISPEPATIENRVKDLHTLLMRLELKPPFILVGHSMGSWINRLYIHHHPDEVVGLVYVDPGDYTRTNEEELEAFTEIGAGQEGMDEYRQGTYKYLDGFSPGYRKELLEGIRHQENGFIEFTALPPLPDIPFVLLASSNRGASPADYSFDKHSYSRVVKRQYLDKMSRWSREVSEGTLVITPNSGHFIQIDEPELVIWAIRRVVFPDIERQMRQIMNKEGIEATLIHYENLKRYYPTARFTEPLLIRLGYTLLEEEKINEAIEIFKLNVMEYPDFVNGYDSLGEAYMIKGNKEQAVANYKKALHLDPGNENARNKLTQLQQTQD